MSTVVWVTVIVLLLPGLLMIGALVVRLLLRGFGGGDDARVARTLDAQGEPIADGTDESPSKPSA